MASNLKADRIISIYGGFAIDLGNALACTSTLMHLALPTTYAGSEGTPILGEERDNLKSTKKHDDILPNIVIYDPELLVTLPFDVAATSGLNAIAHPAEALYTRNQTESSTNLAIKGITHLVDALPKVLINLLNLNFREEPFRDV